MCISSTETSRIVNVNCLFFISMFSRRNCKRTCQHSSFSYYKKKKKHVADMRKGRCILGFPRCLFRTNWIIETAMNSSLIMNKHWIQMQLFTVCDAHNGKKSALYTIEFSLFTVIANSKRKLNIYKWFNYVSKWHCNRMLHWKNETSDYQ